MRLSSSNIPEEMALSIGQILRGRKGTYRLMENLKAHTVFKAQVLSSSAIKSPLYDFGMCFNIEMMAYTYIVSW